MIHYEKRETSKLGSYPSANVTFMTTLALLVAGLFGLLLLHTAKLTSIIQENVNVQVYLNKNISGNEHMKIRQLLSHQDFVLKKDGYSQLKFISKEEAAQTFTKETGEAFLQVLDENPLRDVYIMSIAPEYQSTPSLKTVKAEVEAIDGVFEADYVEGFASAASRNITRAGTILACFSVILLIIVIALINSTIRLALYSQRFLIRSMKLVGATAAFIRKPFLVRAILIGLIASTIANSFLLLSLHYANQHVEALTTLQDPVQVFVLLGTLTVLGIFISFTGTYKAVDKYLNMSLDDLY